MQRRTLKLEVEPRILKYARHCSGYEIAEAAKKAKISEEKLAELEIEKDALSITQVERLANIYKMPLAFFLLKSIPKDIVLPKDFRIVYATDDFSFSPKLMLAVRWARYVQAVVDELSLSEVEYDLAKIKLEDNPEQVALEFRSVVGVPLKEQHRWSRPNTALRKWKEAIEKLGIFILQQNLADDVSAFSLADKMPYIVVLNSAEHENRRIFSLFHEIGHILLHQSGVCTPNDLSRNSKEYVVVEKFCNQFAASFLVPEGELRNDSQVMQLKQIPFTSWHQQDIKDIANRYRVSQEVIYRRLVSLGFLTAMQYEEKREELQKNFDEYRKRKKDKPVAIPQYRKVISQNGRAYASFILEKLHSNRITFADAAEYLNTNSRHIANVEAHI